jgi:hypothetical protein
MDERGKNVRSTEDVVNGKDPVSRIQSRPSVRSAMPREREKYSSSAGCSQLDTDKVNIYGTYK